MMMRTAELIASYLRRAGVRRMYGWAGEGSSLDLVEAARKEGLDFVAPRQLASAAVMAGTEGDLLERPGVCVLPDEGWASIAGVAHAYTGRNPLLCLFSQSPRGSADPFGEQWEEALGSITKGRANLTGARAEGLMRWAWKKANSAPKGPVSLGVASDQSLRVARTRGRGTPALRPAGPSPSGIGRMGRLLVKAGRTVVLAGMGCRTAGTAGALAELVEHLGAPVFTTRRAKGVVADDHPLSAGVFLGSRWEQQLLDGADCVLTVGLDAGGVMPIRWNAGVPVVSLEEYPGRPPFRPRAQVRGDLQQAVVRLKQELPPGGEWRLAEWAQHATAFKARIREALANTGRTGLLPHRVVEIARSVAPRNAIAAVDFGAHALAVTAFWDVYDPKGFLAPLGGGPGSALPSAIAAKLTWPERPAFAFLGEGGLFASLAEIATAGDLGVPVIAVVFLDGSYTLSRTLQDRRHYAPVGVSTGPIRLAELADDLGALGIQVDTEEALRQAIDDALAAPRPALIGARINPHGYRRIVEALA